MLADHSIGWCYILLTLIPHLSLIPVLAQTVNSVPASSPIIIDGVETQNEWDNAGEIQLQQVNGYSLVLEKKLANLQDISPPAVD
jgi:hypothetical protein